MFDVLFFQEIVQKEYKLNYTFTHSYSLQSELKKLDNDFEILGSVLDIPYFFAWHNHKEHSYIGIFKMFHDQNINYNIVTEKDLYWVTCLDNDVSQYMIVFFLKSNEEAIINKVRRLQKLKAFL